YRGGRPPAGPWGPLSARGHFELHARQGKWRLVLASPGGREKAQTILLDEVVLGMGATSWGLSIETGRIEGTGATRLEQERTFVAHLWQDERGRIVVTPVVPDSEGRFVLEAVPAGSGRFVLISRGPGEDPSTLPSLLDVHVPPGGTVQVDLP
ncbi:MAG: hypothetical protein AB1486_20760, partial [Planctomycetota bacterium]